MLTSSPVQLVTRPPWVAGRSFDYGVTGAIVPEIQLRVLRGIKLLRHAQDKTACLAFGIGGINIIRAIANIAIITNAPSLTLRRWRRRATS